MNGLLNMNVSLAFFPFLEMPHLAIELVQVLGKCNKDPGGLLHLGLVESFYVADVLRSNIRGYVIPF